MRKTLYLHIGTPKTGSTAIQVFLRENRRQLACKDWFICTAQDPLDERNLRFLTAYMRVFGIQELRSQGKLQGGVSQESVLLSEWFHAFIQRLRRIKQSRVILSEEMLWWALCDENKLNLFLERLMPLFDVKVIVYLRRQDHYIMSIYQQALKTCNVHAKSCSEWILDPENRQVCTYTCYDVCLEKLVGYVGKKNIILRVYEPQELLNGSVVDDFAGCIGLSGLEGFFVPQENINPGLNARGVALARGMNRMHHGPGFMSFVDRFELRSKLFNERGATYNLLTLRERRDFLAKYSQGNRWVAKEFLGREALFSEPVPISVAGDGDLVAEEDILPILINMLDELSRRMEMIEPLMRILRRIYCPVRAIRKFFQR
jgi:hypothetical protein